ncbi:MAG TPA: hypothetical protein VIF64_16595 [Pyrinomonadaceae bacterium]|jgi:hypothetical protein
MATGFTFDLEQNDLAQPQLANPTLGLARSPTNSSVASEGDAYLPAAALVAAKVVRSSSVERKTRNGGDFSSTTAVHVTSELTYVDY